MAKSYIISRVRGDIVVHNIDYVNLSSKMKEISESLTSISHRGLVIFDNLTSNGFAKNRFIAINFNGIYFDRNTTEIYVPKMIFIKECNDFYRKKDLSASILTKDDIQSLQEKNEDLYDRHESVTLGELMKESFGQWGLRGDPYLWNEIKEKYKDQVLDYHYIEMEIENIYFDLTGHTFENGDFFDEKYAHGGMSSGMISSDFWQHTFVEKIRERMKEYYIHNYEE